MPLSLGVAYSIFNAISRSGQKNLLWALYLSESLMALPSLTFCPRRPTTNFTATDDHAEACTQAFRAYLSGYSVTTLICSTTTNVHTRLFLRPSLSLFQSTAALMILELLLRARCCYTAAAQRVIRAQMVLIMSMLALVGIMRYRACREPALLQDHAPLLILLQGLLPTHILHCCLGLVVATLVVFEVVGSSSTASCRLPLIAVVHICRCHSNFLGKLCGVWPHLNDRIVIIVLILIRGQND